MSIQTTRIEYIRYNEDKYDLIWNTSQCNI